MRGSARLLRGVAACAGVAAAFGLGVGVGRYGSAARPAAPSPTGSPVGEAAGAISADAERAVPSSALDRAAIEGMLAALGDPYAAYRPTGQAVAAASVLDGSYVGLGFWLRTDQQGRVLVTSVLPASGAALGGLRAGDELLSVDQRPVRGVAMADTVAALRGPAGSTVTVVSRGTHGALRTTALRRSAISARDVGAERLAGGVLRLRVAAFSRGAGGAVRAALDEARRQGGLRGAVLDLRGDPGGLLDEAVSVAGAFFDGGAVVSYSRRGDATRVLTAPPGGDTGLPLAVLVDGSTASAAEVVAGALQDRRRALVVGSRSFGKGSVQETVALSDGGSLELTVARYRTPAGRELDGHGIVPDVVVAASPPGGDAQLDRAVTVVGGLLADAGTRSGSARG